MWAEFEVQKTYFVLTSLSFRRILRDALPNIIVVVVVVVVVIIIIIIIIIIIELLGICRSVFFLFQTDFIRLLR
jgi:hypothetical protein